jgi:hypothetical protein
MRETGLYEGNAEKCERAELDARNILKKKKDKLMNK